MSELANSSGIQLNYCPSKCCRNCAWMSQKWSCGLFKVEKRSRSFFKMPQNNQTQEWFGRWAFPRWLLQAVWEAPHWTKVCCKWQLKWWQYNTKPFNNIIVLDIMNQNTLLCVSNIVSSWLDKDLQEIERLLRGRRKYLYINGVVAGMLWICGLDKNINFGKQSKRNNLKVCGPDGYHAVVQPDLQNPQKGFCSDL